MEETSTSSWCVLNLVNERTEQLTAVAALKTNFMESSFIPVLLIVHLEGFIVLYTYSLCSCSYVLAAWHHGATYWRYDAGEVISPICYLC